MAWFRNGPVHGYSDVDVAVVRDTDSVAAGEVAALGFDYFEVGYAAGNRAVDILSSAKLPGQIPSGYAEDLSLHVSLPNALKQGFTLSPEIIARAEDGGRVYR